MPTQLLTTVDTVNKLKTENRLISVKRLLRFNSLKSFCKYLTNWNNFSRWNFNKKKV